jgi:two-component system LytT family sensor kinase
LPWNRAHEAHKIRSVLLVKGFRRTLRDYSLSIGFWVSLSLLVSWQESVAARQEHLPLTFHTLLVLYAVRFLTIGLLTPPLFYIIEKFPVQASNMWRRIWIYLAGYVPFAVVFACIRWVLHTPWLPETLDWGTRTLGTLVDLIYGMFADEFAIYIGIVLAGHAYFYFVLSQQQEREQMQMQQALMQSELQAMKRQMQPHFLFNTLHGITTLVVSDPRRAQQMLLSLSGLLRRSLRHGDADLVPLVEDLKFARDYLAIEAMRLGERLQLKWDIAPDTANLLVPQLILQPLLENAVKHGIAPCRTGGWLQVKALRANNRLTLEIDNSVGDGAVKGTGVGHQNIQSRLSYLFGTDAELTFACDGSVARARVVLPALLSLQRTGREEKSTEEVDHAALGG